LVFDFLRFDTFALLMGAWGCATLFGMKKFVLFGLAGVCCLFTVPLASAQTASETAMPVIELVGTNEVALGKITCGELKLITFVFRNPGTVPVQIKRIVSTCPCIRGYPEETAIPLKGELPITVELNPTKVKDVFKRGLWVHTSDPRQFRIPLVVSGEVIPFFDGFPQESITFRRNQPGEAWTNVITLSAMITNLSLGTPIIKACKDMRVTATVQTNQTRTGTFDLTLVAVPLVTGRSLGTVEIPIEGSPNLPNLRLSLHARVGSELKITPSQFLMVPSDKPLTRNYFVRIEERELDLDRVAISPQREGVTCDVRPSKRKSSFTLQVTVTPEALAKLMQEKDPILSVGYPDYKAGQITFVPYTPDPKKE